MTADFGHRALQESRSYWLFYKLRGMICHVHIRWTCLASGCESKAKEDSQLLVWEGVVSLVFGPSTVLCNLSFVLVFLMKYSHPMACFLFCFFSMDNLAVYITQSWSIIAILLHYRHRCCIRAGGQATEELTSCSDIPSMISETSCSLRAADEFSPPPRCPTRLWEKIQKTCPSQ